MLVPILFSACVKTTGKQLDSSFQYASFRDIPGVTGDEIKAIEELQKRGIPLIYGTALTTETFFIEDDGELGGFTVKLCDWLTELFGIQFKTEIHDLSDVLVMLKTGEINLGAVTVTEDRQKTYYMSAPIIHRSIKVMRIKGRLSPAEIAWSRPVRYVFVEGGTTIDSVTAAFAPGSYEALVARNHMAAYHMLESGEADAFIGTNIAEGAFDPYGGVLTEDFLPLIVTPVSLAADDPAFAPVISLVTKALESGAYGHLTELYRQGYQEYKKNKFLMELCDEERAYVRDTPVIPFAAQFMSYPVSFYNTNGGKWEGIIFDVLDEMEKLTGFKFELVNDEKTDLPELMNLLEKGTAYVMPNMIQSEERRKRFIWPNTTYLSDRFALLSKRSYPNVELNDIPFTRVGFAKGSAFADLFRSWFPNALYTVEYPGTDDAFMALERGEVDLVMSSQSRLTALTNYYELSDYKANYLFSAAFDASFGLNKDQTVLCSIIDKALPLIDTDRIVEQWLSRTYNIETMRLRNQRPWLFGSLVLILCILALFAVSFARSRRTGRQLEKLVRERTHVLELQTAKLQAIFGSLPDIVFCKDLNLRYTQCNRITEEYNGVREADLIGKNDFETKIFPVNVAERIIEADRAALKAGGKLIIEETLPYYNGVTRVLETVRTPLVQNGVIVGLIVIARDITERKKVERELALQTAMLTTLFDSIPDFIFVKDLNLCYVQCNKSYLAHLGFSREDIIGKNDIDGFKEDPVLVEENWWVWDRKVINEGQTFTIEEHIPGANGTNPLYETVKTPLVLDGKVIGLLGISHDITQRKEMEEAALAASRSKSAFLATMSHEIRTPMNSIIGFSDLAMDGEASVKTREYLAKIQSNAQWLLYIINDILDISKIEYGKMELEHIPFDMHELFESCRTLIMPQAVEKGIMLHFYAEPSMGKMPLGDPVRLRQVLVNLLSNAVKFTNSGMVKLQAAIKNMDEKSITMFFEVKDSGIGMTAEQINRIFTPFMQAETGTTRKYGGTGLGLAITKNIVELMGGTLSVESTPGVGSKFSFTLAFETIAMADDMSEKKIVFKEFEKPAFEGEVLLCEDNAMNQQVICEYLARVGLKTVVAENGQIGVDMVQSRKEKGEKQFDIIFMDIHMPVMDGLEASAKIMALNTGVPVVAMTANIMPNDMEIYRQSGMNDCVGKPFTSQELWRCLLKYLMPLRGRTAQKEYLSGNSGLFAGDSEFEKSVKMSFLRGNRNKYDEILKALEAGDVKQAYLLAHTIKGNAGQLGKTILQQAAANVENQLKDGQNLVTGEQLKVLENELDMVLNEFTALLGESAVPASAAAQQAQAEGEAWALELFEKLEPLLKSGNPECLNFAGELRALAGSEQLIQQMDEFDFEAALASLAELKGKLE